MATKSSTPPHSPHVPIVAIVAIVALAAMGGGHAELAWFVTAIGVTALAGAKAIEALRKSS